MTTLHCRVRGIIFLALITFSLSAQSLSEPPGPQDFPALFAPPNTLARGSDPALPAAVVDYQRLDIHEESLAELYATAPQSLHLSLPGSAYEGDIELELTLQPVVPPTVRLAGSKPPQHIAPGLHYRGTVAGDENSLVAFSVFDGELTALITSPQLGNLSLVPLKETDRTAKSEYHSYLLYNDAQLPGPGSFNCGAVDSGVGYEADELRTPTGEARSTDCIGVYLEVDHDVFLEKGGLLGSVNYVTALFNQVATLYADEGIAVSISEIFLWDLPSPYQGTSSSSMLTQFQSVRQSFNGDIGQLLSYKASGGIAVLGGLCHPYTAARLSFASINPTFADIPAYSYSTLVVAHEIGHLLGSQHTHACVWNGNNTAIDGCAGYTEGTCGNPGLPSDGGTIMSYCHITGVGVNLSLGFGIQPRNVMLNKINGTNCLQTVCPTIGGGGGGGGSGNPDGPSGDSSGICSDGGVILSLTLDNFGPETTWQIVGANDSLLLQGGPYGKALNGVIVTDTFCLSDECYDFIIFDSYADGLCCNYGQGSYLLTDMEGNELADGGAFPGSETTGFCLPFDPDSENGCLGFNFQETVPVAYGVNQDVGLMEITDGGNELRLSNNAWKAVPIDYQITPTTMLTFEFRSFIQGEIHGIGLDDNLGISSDKTFRLYGTQAWGNGDFADYPADGQWRSYTIPVGSYYTFTAAYLFFVSDHDTGSTNGNSMFRNVRLTEGAGCPPGLAPGTTTSALPGAVFSTSVYPNPTGASLSVTTEITQDGPLLWAVVNTTGTVVQSGNRTATLGSQTFSLEVAILPPGTYFLRQEQADGETHSVRFTKLP